MLKLVLWACKVLLRVPGEIKRSRDLRGGRRSWTLNFAQKRSWVGRWSWAEQVGRLLLRVVQVVRQQRCNGHCLSDSVQHSSWNSNCSVHKSLGNGLNTSIVLAAVHGLSGLFRAVSEVEPFTLSPPSHSVPVPNRPTRFCGRKATLNQTARFQARSRDLRGGRWSWTFKFAQKRSWVGRWSWAEQVGPLLLRVVQVVHQQQCNGHCLCACTRTGRRCASVVEIRSLSLSVH